MRIALILILPATLLLAACTKSNDNNSGGGTGPITGGGPTVTTFAGSGAAGAANGTKQQASFNDPTQIALDGNGFFYIVDKQNHALRRMSPQGEVVTLAGTGTAGFSNANNAVSFNFPSGVIANYGGNVIYVADEGNNAIRRITNQNVAITFAGNGLPGYKDASDTAARLSAPVSLAMDSIGNVYVADNGNNVIRKITAGGGVTTLAGSGSRGSADGTGNKASFNQPQAICIDKLGNVYVADQGNNEIRKITALGVVTTIAGNGTAGFLNGKWTASEFNGPAGIAIDASGNNLYVGDTNNNLIRQINLTGGAVSTVAGNGQKGSTNADPLNSSFNNPQGLVVVPDGRIFVVDTGNNEIRVIAF